MTTQRTLFDNPPVTEVVFQVGFPELKPFGQPHIGVFWNEVRDEFPTIKAVPRIGLRPQQLLEGNGLPDNRVWLVHKGGNQILQLQDDRFLFNWAKSATDDSYPGFDVLFPIFSSYLGRFVRFLDDEEFPTPTITDFELTYINHVYRGAWQTWSDVVSVFPVVAWNTLGSDYSNLKGLRFNANCELPGSPDHLSVSIESRVQSQTKEPLLYSEIKVTGRDEVLSLESLEHRFRAANQAINKMFVSLTSDNAQKLWKRK